MLGGGGEGLVVSDFFDKVSKSENKKMGWGRGFGGIFFIN